MGQNKKLPPGVNNNEEVIDRIKNQKGNPNMQQSAKEMLSKLTPEQKEKLLKQHQENQQIKDEEAKHENNVEYVKPATIEDPRTLQTKNPQPCEDDESFEHFKLDLNEGAVPDFLFLSAISRPPTQFFSRFLSAHENIKAPRVLEPHFFSYPWVSKMNAKNYQGIYSNTVEAPEKSELVGDFSSSYLYHPLAPKRIATQIPDIKIILILQNPLDRAYNLYLDRVNEGLETLSFEQVITREFKEVPALRKTFRECFNEKSCDKNLCVPSTGSFFAHDAEQTPRELLSEVDTKDYLLTSYVFRSIYDDMVERWLNSFPRENFLIMSQFDFMKDKYGAMSNITQFLGLPEHHFTVVEKQEEEEMEEIEEEEEEEEKPINTPMSPKTQATLCNFFKRFNTRLYDLIGAEFTWCAKFFQQQQQQGNKQNNNQ